MFTLPETAPVDEDAPSVGWSSQRRGFGQVRPLVEPEPPRTAVHFSTRVDAPKKLPLVSQYARITKASDLRIIPEAVSEQGRAAPMQTRHDSEPWVVRHT